MKDMRAVRFNEKVKRASTIIGNGGLALLVAGISRWYLQGLDLFAGIWILMASVLIWSSLQINNVLESEEE
ncbi:MAG: hypothetical protein KA533_08980 [Sphingobium sp.]|nr:hypothetical protein [Sphingobium sp.]MBP9158418.1 hypothetical protein [Sphingobium sp.]